MYSLTSLPCRPDVQIKEEPDSGEWQLSSDSTLNTSDLSHLHVRLVDEEDQYGQEGKRLRRVACTCPNCKESGGRWVLVCTLCGCRFLHLHGKWECWDANRPYLCFAEDLARGRRSSIFATSWAVGKCMERHPTCEHTCAGIRGSGLSFAAGCSVGRGSHAAMSCRDTGEHTQVPFLLHQCLHIRETWLAVSYNGLAVGVKCVNFEPCNVRVPKEATLLLLSKLTW